MQIEIVVIAAFAVLTIGRVAWEKVTRRDVKPAPADEREWSSAIR